LIPDRSILFFRLWFWSCFWFGCHGWFRWCVLNYRVYHE